jgi:HlyD family secretion protein
MKKWILIIAGIGILVAIAFLFRSDRTQEISEDIRTGVVQRDNLRITVAATGVVTPHIEVEIKSKAGGEIISFPFEESDHLKKGEVAVRLDPEIEQSRVNQANADLLIAEAKLEKARITLKDRELRLKRQKSLFEDKVISRQDLDNVILDTESAKSDVKISEAELVRSRETLKEAEDRLRDTKIRAPLTGTILRKYAEEGQVIASTTSSVSEGTLLFTMADLNRIYIEAMVDEADIGRIIPGQDAEITVDAYLDKKFLGKVVRIAPKGRVESTITVFDVTVELKPVMTANVEILTDFKRDVLLVPSEAIKVREGEHGLYKYVEGKTLWSSVRTGNSDGILTEVQGDIREGEEVVLSGMEPHMETTDTSRKLRRGFWFFGRKK